MTAHSVSHSSQSRALWLSTIAFTVNFAVWTIFSIIGVQIKKDLGLTDTQFGVPTMVARFFGGSSLLIVVGVMLDTMRQVESHLVMRYYDGFLTKGKLRGRK